jgi:UDP-N-acetylmuramyl pentapeptide phosphotransferase/UDP-N-acetylglucosamine-1-phosphate transferase
MSALLDAVLFATGAGLAWVLVYVIRLVAPRLHLVDLPNARSIHTQPTPRGGGAAIVVVCVLGVAAAASFGLQPNWREVAGYLVGASLIVGVSLVDDVRALPASLRLAAQVAAAVFMLTGLASQPGLLMSTSQLAPGWLVMGIALLWSVGITNAYNFMDGIDGLAATEGLVAGLGWTLLAWLSGQSWLAVLALLVAAGCLGFVFHNWHPARIFMGDVGSAFLGFTFAFMALATPRHIDQLGSGVLILWPFVFDAGFTMLRRLQRRENLLVAHRSHLYQRLVLAGWRQAAVTSLYGVFALVTVGLGIAWWLTTSSGVRLFIVAVVLLASVGLVSLVVRIEHSQPVH